MTSREAIFKSWVLAGEPSDLDPILAGAPYDGPDQLDASSEGVAHYLRELSFAQTLLANWRTSRGRPIRFGKFQTQKNVKLGLSEANRTYTITYIDETTIRIDAAPTWFTPEMFESCRFDVMQVSGSATETTTENMVMVAEWAGLNMEFYLRDAIEDPGFVPVSRSVEIYFDRFTIDDDGVMSNGSYISLPPSARNVTRVTQTSSGAFLTHVHSKEDLYNQFMTTGIPSEYYILGERMFFDRYIEAPIWFVVEFQRLPYVLTSLDDEIDIPTEWHDVLIAIVEWREVERMQDTEKGMVKRSQISGLINTLRTDIEEGWLRNQTGGLYVQMEERT